MIGRIGASAVTGWAAQAAITANESFHDDKGWDVFLQLPPRQGSPSGALDRVAPEISCMVQVKATLDASTSVPIKLSNWRRMCTDPLPWFVLAIRLDPEQLSPMSAHLVHVDKSWCAKVLRRLREMSNTEALPLHKHFMNVTWSSDDEMTQLHGRELQRLVKQHVADQHQYVAKKLQWVSEVGYDHPARSVTVQVSAGERETLYRYLAELATGQRTTFPPGWRASVSDVRFGLRAKVDEFDASAGEMEFHAPPQGTARLRITTSSGAHTAEFDCKVFRARAVFPFLPEEHDPVRLVAEDLQVFLAPRNTEKGTAIESFITISFPEAPVPINRLRSVVTVGRALASTSDPLRISLVSEGSEAPLTAPAAIPIDSSLRQLVAELDAALTVCEHFAVPDNSIVSVQTIREQAPWANFMAAILNDPDGEVRAPYTNMVPVGAVFGVVSEAQLDLEDRSLAMIMGSHGVVTECHEVPERGAVVVVEKGHMVHRKLILTDDIKTNAAKLDANRSAIRDELAAVGCRHVLNPETLRKLTQQE